MNFKKILVPVTLSSDSRAAVTVASRLAEECGASIILLHAVQLAIAGEERGIPRGRLVDELCRDAEVQMRQFVDTVRVSVPVEFVACEGRPADVIVRQARALAADVIVMYTHGKRGWLRWLHRRTALRVLQHAPCLVWLVSPNRRRSMSDGVGILEVLQNPAIYRPVVPHS